MHIVYFLVLDWYKAGFIDGQKIPRGQIWGTQVFQEPIHMHICYNA